MLLKVTHTTDLSYDALISESVMELRMCPRQEEGQHRLSFALAVGPRTIVTSYFDWLGNTVHAFTVNSFHRQIRIVATSVLETQRFRISPEDLTDTYPLDENSYDYDTWDFLQFGGPISDSEALQQMAAEVRPRPGESLGVVAQRILDLINERIVYRTGMTTASSSIAECLDHRYGVCQDFTHLMIGVARALKIPARYVSGLIHPDRERYRGYSETHAWCELLFPSVGWVGFDPTNRCIVGQNFVKVAIGRDYRDIPPNKGVYRGKAVESISVAVNTEELEEIPAALAAERLESIPLDIYGNYSMPVDRTAASQQQEHQQQQTRDGEYQQQQQQQQQ
ncbi:MAG TPA: transglutaminase family protein [Tepidisphaeraceae bacterium]|nr:transglutaminase family protein [Tepidisphaeraceae bacterium]